MLPYLELFLIGNTVPITAVNYEIEHFAAASTAVMYQRQVCDCYKTRHTGPWSLQVLGSHIYSQSLICLNLASQDYLIF